MQRQLKVEELKKASKNGQHGTPVTEETFRIWQEKKRKQRQEQAKKLVEQEFKKKKGGKGLSVLSGRDLYEYKKDVFDKVEDDNDESYDSAKANAPENQVNEVAAQVKSDLFLQGSDEDLDDLDDD